MTQSGLRSDAMMYVPCPLCGDDDGQVRWKTPLEGSVDAPLESFFRCTNSHYSRFGRIVRCRVCGMLFRNPQEKNLLEAYRAAVDEDYLEEWPARQETFKRSLKQLHRYAKPPGRLLDVGASTGFFLQVAQQAGWQVTGLEPSHWAAAQARAQGLEIYEGTLEEGLLAPESFEVVTLWDVLEHVRTPRALLQATYEVLRPGGIIALTTMDVGAPVARALGRHWPHLMRMHLCYFRAAQVVRLLREVGFVEPRCQPHVRLLSGSYLASRFRFAGPRLAQGVEALMRVSRMQNKLLPIYLGDLFAVYAQKPETPPQVFPAD